MGKGTEKAKKEMEKALGVLTQECENKISAIDQSLNECVDNLVQVHLQLLPALPFPHGFHHPRPVKGSSRSVLWSLGWQVCWLISPFPHVAFEWNAFSSVPLTLLMTSCALALSVVWACTIIHMASCLWTRIVLSV